MADKLPTVRGIALFPRLTEPDTKFKAAGEYSVKLRLSAEDADRINAMCEPIRQEAVDKRIEDQAAKGKKIAAAKIKLADLPVKPETDEDGNETGLYLANFRMTASGVSKKTNKPWERRPALFDARRNPIKPDGISIWSGSELRVAFEVIPYYTDLAGAGAALRLMAVQVLRLVSGGDGSAAAEAFEDEGDDGYTHQSQEAANQPADDETTDDSAEDF